MRDLGHEEPTILLTNDRQATQAKLITRYAQGMLLENALSDTVRFFIRRPGNTPIRRRASRGQETVCLYDAWWAESPDATFFSHQRIAQLAPNPEKGAFEQISPDATTAPHEIVRLQEMVEHLEV